MAILEDVNDDKQKKEMSENEIAWQEKEDTNIVTNTENWFKKEKKGGGRKKGR